MIVTVSQPFPTASRQIRFLWIVLLAICSGLIIEAVTQSFNPASVLLGPFLLNRVTVSLALMVTFVGSIVMNFSLRYMAFDSSQDQFCLWLFLTALSGGFLMLSDHLLVLFSSWGAMSICLHQLLAHYKSNPIAQRVAWRKFGISRLGDLALLAGVLSVFKITQSWSLSFFLTHIHRFHSQQIAEVSLWISLAALTKSAQFPFHGWLPQTLEAPTPVSAIMHAGAINGGGALLLKFAPAIAETPLASLLLSTVGSLTMVAGMNGLWKEPTFKGKLAWSTVAQMGFMTAECGISAFSAAFLHILAHGIYKAEGFLNSGTLQLTAIRKSPAESGELGWILGCSLVCLIVFWMVSITFLADLIAPTRVGIGLILALSIGQASVVLRREPDWLCPLVSILLTIMALAIYWLVERYVSRLVPSGSGESPLYWIAALLPGLTLLALTIQQQVTMRLPKSSKKAARALLDLVEAPHLA